MPADYSALNKTMPRRTFLRVGITGAATSLAAWPSSSRSANKLPNIVFIICDQMRGDALSILGSANAITPNLDLLAKNGVLFENCFSNSPVCIPSRKSIFSGLHPHQHGSMTNLDGSFLKFNDTMMDYFQQRGYRIGWVGKNHTYKKSEFAQFDVAHIRAREPFRKYNRFVPPFWHTDTYWPAEQCYPKKNTDDAISFIQSTRKDEPFFLHVSYFDPHPPYMAPSEFTSRFCSADMQPPEFIDPAALSDRLAEYARAMGFDRMSRTDLTETMRYYYAAVAWGVDHQVGRIMNALKQRDLAENTIVIFTADHGDFMGEYNMVRKGMFLYDALLHVPMIWFAPGRILQNRKVQTLAQGIDIFPTLVDLTGGNVPVSLQGRSLKPFLAGAAKDDDDYAIFTSAGYNELDFQLLHQELEKDEDTPLHTRVLRQNMNPRLRSKCIRSRKWKLIMSDSRPSELYHMNGRHCERENVAEKPEFAAIRQELEKRLHAWWPW